MTGEPGPLAGKRALVTGAAAGIGRAIALALAQAGAALLLVDRDKAGLAESRGMAVSLGVDAAIHLADLSDAGAVVACADAALAAGPHSQNDQIEHQPPFQPVLFDHAAIGKKLLQVAAH